jgi:hypothetical protein
MNDRHVAPSELEAFLHGGLPAERVLEVARHLSTCSECGAEAAAEAASRRVAARVLGGDDLHLDFDADLVPYVEGGADLIARERIEAHLAACPMCRADLDDLRPIAASIPPGRRWPYVLATAAAIAVVAFLGVLATRGPARPDVHVVPRAAPDRREVRWQSLVDEALRNGIAKPAALRELAPRRGALRGSESGPRVQLAPLGVVVEETRPAFSWSPVEDARYRVFIFDGTRQVAAGPVLRATAWRCDAELTRGRDYQWQLEITTGERQDVAPAASMRIADAATATELADARRRHPGDHLLLGILYARNGIADAAERELTLAARNHPRAARLLVEVRAWRASVAEADQGV